MKKIIGILLSLILLAGCTMQSEQGVSISVDNTIPRGIESTSMVAESYSVTVKNGTAEIGRYDIPRDTGKLTVMLEVGTYDFEAVALNKDNIAIGGGERTVEVVPGKISDCTITVSEYEGNGTLGAKVVYDGTESLSLAVWMPDSDLATAEPFKVQALPGNGNEYSGKLSLDKGYWIIAIMDGNGNRLSRFETVRITSGREAIWSVDLSSSSSGNIDDQIKPTPYVKILGNAGIEPGTEASFTVESRNISNPVFSWFVDGLELGTGSTFTWTCPEDYVGEHRLDVIAQSDTIAWSDSLLLKCLKSYVYDVSGKTEFRLDGEVLLPWYFTVDCSGASLEDSGMGFCTLDRKAYWVSDAPGAVTFSLPEKWAGYDLVFENRGNEGGYDIVYVMVDRQIPDAAYLDISFDLIGTPVELAQGIWMGSDTLNPDHDPASFSDLGLFLIPADMATRRIKIDPGVYAMSGDNSQGGNLGELALDDIDRNKFEVLPGATRKLTVIEISKDVTLRLPGSCNNMASIIVGNSENGYEDRPRKINGDSIDFKMEFGTFDILVRIPGLAKAYERKGAAIDRTTTEVILDEIAYEKSFYISMSDQFYENGDTMTARVVLNGIADPVVKWWVDGVETTEDTLSINRPVTGDAQSVHVIKAEVHDGTELIGTAERTVVWCPEKLKEVTVGGDVELKLIPDIVFKRDLQLLSVNVNGKYYTDLGLTEYLNSKSCNFPEDVVLSAVAEAPYDYWLFTWKEGDVTKVYFVLDQEMEEYGVLNLEWNCPFPPEKAGSVWEYINGSHDLVLTVNEYLDGASLKMDPGNYTLPGVSSVWSGEYSYHFSPDKKDFTLTAGTSCDLKWDSGF